MKRKSQVRIPPPSTLVRTCQKKKKKKKKKLRSRDLKNTIFKINFIQITIPSRSLVDVDMFNLPIFFFVFLFFFLMNMRILPPIEFSHVFIARINTHLLQSLQPKPTQSAKGVIWCLDICNFQSQSKST
jgi:hypothetical protein